ncbi:hypothetical protein CRM22_002118, partial [Opisthorchis felineus]
KTRNPGPLMQLNGAALQDSSDPLLVILLDNYSKMTLARGVAPPITDVRTTRKWKPPAAFSAFNQSLHPDTALR